MISSLDPSSDRFLADLTRLQSISERAQRRISSGVKISEAADAPDQIGALLQLQADLGRNTQIKSNLVRVKAEVDTAEQAVGEAIQITDRLVVLASQGVNGTQTADTRLALAQEVKGLQEQLVSLTGTKVEGRFIFAGDADRLAPYHLNATGDTATPNGVARLTQSAATRRVEDPNGQTFQVGKTAQDIFDPRNADDSLAPENLFAAVNSLRIALENNDVAGIQTALPAIRKAADYVNVQQGFYGVAQNRITAASEWADRKETSLRIQLSAGRDADVAEAALELSSTRNQLEAALSARAKLPRTSLFDFLG